MRSKDIEVFIFYSSLSDYIKLKNISKLLQALKLKVCQKLRRKWLIIL